MVMEREEAISLMLVYPKPLVLKRKRAVSKIREKVFRFMAPFSYRSVTLSSRKDCNR